LYEGLTEANKKKFNKRKITYKPPTLRSMESFTDLVVIGEGTYGKVYRAFDKRTNQLVALKRMKMNNEKEGV
jgi:serine/threonine protein kinase